MPFTNAPFKTLVLTLLADSTTFTFPRLQSRPPQLPLSQREVSAITVPTARKRKTCKFKHPGNGKKNEFGSQR